MSHRVAGFLDGSEIAMLTELVDSPAAAFEAGRQGTGYEKCDLGKTRVTPGVRETLERLYARALVFLDCAPGHEHDAYLLRYLPGAFVPPHVDPAPEGKEHARINALMSSSHVGGELLVKERGFEKRQLINLWRGDALIFRPDIEEHEVTLVTAGVRLVFTVGVLR